MCSPLSSNLYLIPSQTAAQKLTAVRLYGKAVEYCARFSDVRALKQVVHTLANEYLEHGNDTS